jgi:hypothetical protein
MTETKDEHPTGSTANTLDCFRTFIGQALRGFFNKGGDSFLIFEDGRALVFHHETGAYWVAVKNDVDRELDIVVRRLRKETASLSNVLHLAGVADQQRRSAR